ncbi:hypothetical protein MTO96_037154 [Rhipicephalus appendiculatus]
MASLPRLASLSPSCLDWKQEKLARALLELESGSRPHAASIADPTEVSLVAATPPTFERQASGRVPILASAASNQLAVRIASVGGRPAPSPRGARLLQPERHTPALSNCRHLCGPRVDICGNFIGDAG